MAGTDTVRGIAYQQAQAILTAIEALLDDGVRAIRVEGLEDVVDIECLGDHDVLLRAQQIKTRADTYAWGQSELLAVLSRWALVEGAGQADFEFVTDGRLGPTGERVQKALMAAGETDLSAIASLLDVSEADPACQVMIRSRIRQDRSSTIGLLLQAQGQVVALLPTVRTGAEAFERAQNGVDRLFRLLTVRASEKDSARRRVEREEIATALGVPPEVPPSSRWTDGFRNEYIRWARQHGVEPVIAPKVLARNNAGEIQQATSTHAPSAPGTVEETLEAVLHTRLGLIFGPTGTGKTTASQALPRLGAQLQRAVLVVPAEAYVPGRLTSLIADTLQQATGRVATATTGSEFLRDALSTLVIDGASEMPSTDRQWLADEVRTAILADRACSLLLVGRDEAELNATLPTLARPSRYALKLWDHTERRTVAANILDERGHVSASANALASSAESALSGAADNPFLFSTSVRLLGEGFTFDTRAQMYGRLIEEMAIRGRMSNIDSAAAVLGLVYAELLDEGRRYCDQIEWQVRLNSARDRMRDTHGIQADIQQIHDASMRAGLVVPIGARQTIVPAHDSIADYLAAQSHAKRLAPIPTHPGSGDAQRLEFTAEIAGVNGELAGVVMRTMPFLAPKLAVFDLRDIAADSMDEVIEFMRFCLPPELLPSFALWRESSTRVVATLLPGGDPPRYVDRVEGMELMKSFGGLTITGGPLAVVSGVWRAVLRRELRAPNGIAPSRLHTAQDAVELLRSHVRATQMCVRDLVAALSPPGHVDALTTAVGQLGIRAVVAPSPTTEPMFRWPVQYRHDTDVDVTVAQHNDSRLGSSSVEYLTGMSPGLTAARRVSEAIDSLAAKRWIN